MVNSSLVIMNSFDHLSFSGWGFSRGERRTDGITTRPGAADSAFICSQENGAPRRPQARNTWPLHAKWQNGKNKKTNRKPSGPIRGRSQSEHLDRVTGKDSSSLSVLVHRRQRHIYVVAAACKSSNHKYHPDKSGSRFLSAHAIILHTNKTKILYLQFLHVGSLKSWFQVFFKNHLYRVI